MQGTIKLEDPLSQKTETHTVGISADLGITNSLSFSASLPVIHNLTASREIYNKGTSLGDLSLLFNMFLSPSILSKATNVQLSVGATMPMGKGIVNVETDESNFVSGTIDPLFSAVIAVMLTPHFNASASFISRQIVYSSMDGQQLGDYYSGQARMVYAPPAAGFSVSSGLKYVSRGQDIIDDAPFANSGGRWLYFTPGFSKNLWGDGESPPSLWAELEWPLYQRVKGIQLVADWNLRVGFSFGFSLFGHDSSGRAPGDHLLMPG